MQVILLSVAILHDLYGSGDLPVSLLDVVLMHPENQIHLVKLIVFYVEIY